MAGYARSEANLEQIVDGLHEQEVSETSIAMLSDMKTLICFTKFVGECSGSDGREAELKQKSMKYKN